MLRRRITRTDRSLVRTWYHWYQYQVAFVAENLEIGILVYVDLVLGSTKTSGIVINVMLPGDRTKKIKLVFLLFTSTSSMGKKEFADNERLQTYIIQQD